MKVLMLSDFGMAHGGAEIETLLLRDGLRKRGHDVLLLSSSARPSDLPILADAVCAGTLSSAQPWLQAANPLAYRAVRRITQEFHPDVVHLGIFELQLSPLILPVLENYPVVHRAHWVRAICPTGAKLLPDRSLCKNRAGTACYRSRCLSLSRWAPAMVQGALARHWRNAIDVITAASNATRQALAAEGFDNVVVVYNGFPATAQRPPLSDPPTACFAGRLVKEKGIDLLLRAWKQVLDRIPNARLVVAGDGPDRPVLQRMAAPGVTFTGYLSASHLERAAASAWVQVVPSICFEAFGRVAAEALMRGTAVVASRIGGLPEVVENLVTGLLVAPNSEDELGQALIKLLSNRELCEKMGKAGREVVTRRFSEENFIDSHARIYEDLIRARSSKPPVK